MRQHSDLIPLECICLRHKQGEYGETFKHRPSFVKQHSISGRIYPVVQIEPWNMKNRVEKIRRHMNSKGYSFRAVYELPDLSYLPYDERFASIDPFEDLGWLIDCVECRKLIMDYGLRRLEKELKEEKNESK